MKLDFEKTMKKQLELIVSNAIDELICEETNKFYEKLSSKKDKYIAELMKSIRIYSEQESIDSIPRYKIIIENTYRIEKEK